MANITLIQRHINRGYSKVGVVLGDVYSWYRPTDPQNPISSVSLLGTMLAQFSPDAQFNYYRAADFATADRWYGAFQKQKDIQAGDYFIGLNGTFYLTYFGRISPLQVVWCNRTVTVGRMFNDMPTGASTEYGGQTVQNTTPILTSWPASVRQLGSGMKMRGTEMKLPSDAPLGAYGIYLPNLPGTPIEWNDVLQDELGRRYAISTLEETQLGWRISAEMWPT
jgi:hypothetical protein